MMVKHNKKRNVGLISEFLARHIAGCVLNNESEDSVKNAQNLWLESFSPNSELAKEQAMFNALYKTTTRTRETAASLLESVKSAARQQSAVQLDTEKTVFLDKLSKVVPKTSDFFNRDIEDYKTRATIQVLLNTWRENDIVRIAETIHLEEQVLEHLMNETKFQKPDPTVLSLNESEVDELVVKIMKDKFDNKYKNVLTEEQKKMVNLYTFSKDQPHMKQELVDMINEIRENTLAYVEYESTITESRHTRETLGKLQTILTESTAGLKHTGNIVSVNDDTIVFYLNVLKFRDELAGKE